MLVPIIQYSDNNGNKAYAYTHWDAVANKPAIALKSDIPDLSEYLKKSDDIFLVSPNNQRFKLIVDNDGNLSTEKEA